MNTTERRLDVQYALLIYDDPTSWEGMSEAERGQVFQEYGTLTQAMKSKGAYVDGNPLQPTPSATSVRVRDGERLVTDGPFAETKEQLGGYYIVEAESLDEAIEWAGKIPSARFGTVEVRPVMQIPAGVEAG
jgi:hypothetical protein